MLQKRSDLDRGYFNIDLSEGTMFEVFLKHPITDITVSNVPKIGSVDQIAVFIKQDPVGHRTVSWMFDVVWCSGFSPTLTHIPNSLDVVLLRIRNNGAELEGLCVSDLPYRGKYVD
jgi:hypothetical protein